mmetsp:Transcript_14188/g.34579  ORF Transcript_14188/g.34579 Transcript_14188/m.34579 type:complete len:394 (-) Transcript_14188:311-1492(-)
MLPPGSAATATGSARHAVRHSEGGVGDGGGEEGAIATAVTGAQSRRATVSIPVEQGPLLMPFSGLGSKVVDGMQPPRIQTAAFSPRLPLQQQRVGTHWPATVPSDLQAEDVRFLTVKQLKENCRALRLKTRGNKDCLVTRLVGFLISQDVNQRLAVDQRPAYRANDECGEGSSSQFSLRTQTQLSNPPAKAQLFGPMGMETKDEQPGHLSNYQRLPHLPSQHPTSRHFEQHQQQLAEQHEPNIRIKPHPYAIFQKPSSLPAYFNPNISQQHQPAKRLDLKNQEIPWTDPAVSFSSGSIGFKDATGPTHFQYPPLITSGGQKMDIFAGQSINDGNVGHRFSSSILSNYPVSSAPDTHSSQLFTSQSPIPRSTDFSYHSKRDDSHSPKQERGKPA